MHSSPQARKLGMKKIQVEIQVEFKCKLLITGEERHAAVFLLNSFMMELHKLQ